MARHNNSPHPLLNITRLTFNVLFSSRNTAIATKTVPNTYVVNTQGNKEDAATALAKNEDMEKITMMLASSLIMLYDLYEKHEKRHCT
jgi:hypothetical protein